MSHGSRPVHLVHRQTHPGRAAHPLAHRGLHCPLVHRIHCQIRHDFRPARLHDRHALVGRLVRVHHRHRRDRL